MNKKPVVVFSVADRNNFPYALRMLKMLNSFHKDWPVILYTNETDTDKLKQLPKQVGVRDLNPYLEDQMFFYRATPILAEPLIDEYELVIKMDADQLVLGNLSYVLDTTDYDVATVINWNRHDIQFYPVVELVRIGIAPIEYFNCGFVAMRSKKFVHNWTVACFSEQFNRLQYKEQDILNILCYFGNYNVRCLDHPDIISKTPNRAFWGLIAKGELNRAKLRGDQIYVPKGFGTTPFPPEDLELKVVHMAGGNEAKKDNWAAFFPPEVMKRIEEIGK